MILANTAAKIGTAEGWAARLQQVAEHGMESIIAGTAERWFTAAFRNANPARVSQILERFKNNNVQGYCTCCSAIGSADFRADLYKLEVPTLIISGSQDIVTTVADGKYMAKRIPLASHVQLDAAHLSNIGQPGEFAKHILHFTQH
jgi:pimeloyl-ACP methyl ester carboxylesterase